MFFNSEYNCFYAESGKKALQILKEYEINLMITDIRMNGMDGFQLLEKVKEQYPKVIRIALSGYSKKNDVLEALEKNLIRLYLHKPWDNSELINIVKKIFEFENLLLNQNLLEYFNNLESLPTVPEIYMKINQMIEKNESVDRITREIEIDQSLSVRILKIANSAFYGNSIGSVKQAIMYIGLNNIKSIILSNSIFGKDNLVKAEILWKHALLTNKIAGYIYQKNLLKKIPSEYSSAGLLHDIGRVLTLNYFEKENTKVEDLIDNSPVDLAIRTQYEYEVFGFDHTKLGGYLLNWWGIPFPVVESAVFHHDPLNKCVINDELVSVIYLANIIAWEITEQKKGDIINTEVIKKLGITPEKFFEKIDKFIESEYSNSEDVIL